MSQSKFKNAKRLKRTQLRNALSSQIQTVLSKASKQRTFDQTIIDEMHQATRAIFNFEERVNADQVGSMIVDKEGRALRSLLNQIEERIEVLAQQSANDIVTRKNSAAISGENSNRRAVEASSSTTSASAK